MPLLLIVLLPFGVALGGFFASRRWAVSSGDSLGLATVLVLAGGFLWLEAHGGLKLTAFTLIVAGVAVAVGAIAPQRGRDTPQR